MSPFWSKPVPANAHFSLHPFLPNAPAFPNKRSGTFLPDKKQWTQMVEKALEEIAKGHLEKVVLARCAIYECEKTPDPSAILKTLQSRAMGATLFCFSEKTQTFLGATPELLFARKDNQIETVAMAGTRKRGKTPRADQMLERQLLSSAKDLREWSFLPRHFQTTLAPLCDTPLTFSPLCVYKTPTVQHLYSRCRASLKNPRTDTEILHRLHPTPALCGTPTDAALSLIRELEPFDRGFYGGAVGWSTPDASEYHVAIRSCSIVGNTVYLYTAAGIVAGSHPDAEWEELNQKLQLYKGIFF